MNTLRVSERHEWRLIEVPECNSLRWALRYIFDDGETQHLRFAGKFEAETLDAAKREIEQLQQQLKQS